MTRLASCVALLVAVAGCRSTAPTTSAVESAAITVFLIRHAETAPDGTRDAGLSDAGHQRAEAYAERFANARLRTVYATEYRRTRETAAPVAEREGVDIVVAPYGAGPLDVYVARLADRVRTLLDAPAFEPAEGVLVVGHSNTTPSLAEALLGRPVSSIAEDEYDRVIGLLVYRDKAVLLPSSADAP